MNRNKIKQLLGLNLPVVLASASPRRKHLLAQIGLDFTIHVSNFAEENLPLDIPPAEYVQTLALHKAQNVAFLLEIPSIVIGADTVVVLSQKIMNKPTSEESAETMLKTLSGRTHEVFTGISLVNSATKQAMTAVQRTEVTFRDLDLEEIRAYIQTGSPMDKAGAYGIQDDFGAVFIKEIRGCYYNVVGLPLELLYCELKKFCSGL